MTKETIREYKAPKTLDDKAFFASYLNMARHNAYIVLSHITEQIGYKPAAENQLTNMACINQLNNSKTPEITKKTIQLLRESFPFLKFYYDAEKRRLEKINKTQSDEKENTNPIKEQLDERKIYYEILTKILKQLDAFRNEFTHADAKELDFYHRKNFFYDMEKIFETAIRRIIEIRNFKEEDVLHLKKFDGSEKVKGKLSPKPNPAFNHSFLNANKTNYTMSGLAFLICLFLEKSYGYKFLKQLKGFKASSTAAYKATTEAFTVFYIRLPKQRINQTISNPVSVALDMFNELKKCPAELYDLLSKEDAEKFRVVRDDEYTINEDDSEEDILMKRFENRFPFFALQFIDQKEIFQNLRFQINMGNYIHKAYENKHSVDGENRIRRLKKNIKTFARLQDLNDLRLEKWKAIINDKPQANEIKEYMTDTYPHYHLKRNVIGLKITEQPLINLPHKPPPSYNEKPDFWLSVYELPAMMFLILLEKKQGNRSIVEDIILKYRKNKLALLTNINKIKNLHLTTQQLQHHLKDEYLIDIHELPKQLVAFLIGENLKEQAANSFVKHAKAKINELLADSKKRKEKILNDLDWLGKGKKPGKKSWTEIKSGVIGDFLAKDMLYLQPSLDGLGKDKITSQNFQILQASLAFFGRDKHLLTNIFKNCGLTHSKNPHPFLSKINLHNHQDIVSFYIDYLNKRLGFLKECLTNSEYANYHFLKPNISKWRKPTAKFSEKELENRLIKNTVFLPRGIFKDALVQWFKNNGSENMKAVASQPKVNAIYLIQQYFALEKNDDCSQAFYDYKRTYPIINKMLDTRKINEKVPLQKHFFNTADAAFTKMMKERVPQEIKYVQLQQDKEKIKKAFNKLNKNEKQIRLQKAEDMLLFLMAKQMLFAQVANDVQLKMDETLFQLKNMHPKNNSDITTLSLQIPFEAVYQVYATDKKNIQRLNKLHTVTIYQQKLKAKNYGDFAKFTKDRRLNNLFMWLPPDSRIERSQLQKELDNYDTQRLLLFEVLHQFEKLAVAKTGKAENGKSFFDEILQAFYKAYPAFTAEEALATAIRNAIAHNQYPQPHLLNEPWVSNVQLPNIANAIAEKGIALFNNYCTILKA